MATFYVQRLHPMLRMDRPLRACSDGSGRSALLSQGSLDSACGIYALAMALTLLEIIDREHALRLLHSRQTALKRIRRWTESVFHSGMSENDLAAAVEAASLNINVSRGESGEHQACLSHGLRGLRNGHVAILGIDSRGGAFHHWVVAAGLGGEEEDGHFRPSSILCLDSYSRAWPYCEFNARLSLTIPRPSARYLLYSSSKTPRTLVTVSNSVVLSNRRPRG